MNKLSLDNISKYYGDKMLFSDISLYVNDYDKIGLIGVTATGKTTLLKIITSVDVLDYGKYSDDRNTREFYMVIFGAKFEFIIKKMVQIKFVPFF